MGRNEKGCIPRPSRGPRPACSSARPPGRRGRAGRRQAGDPVAPEPGETRAGPRGGRAWRRRRRGRGAPTPARRPGTRAPAPGPAARPCCPARHPCRSTASRSRDSQLQPLVGCRRHPAPPPPSSSVRPPRPASPPRLRRYRSPWRGGRSPSPAPPLSTPRQASERTGGGRGQTSRIPGDAVRTWGDGA